LNARQLPFHAINSHAVGEIIHFNDWSVKFADGMGFQRK
jgi:hypothetical protein